MRTAFYGGGTHDRMANDRHDEASTERKRADPGARFIPLWRGQHVFLRDGEHLRALMPTRAAFQDQAAFEALPWCYLGTDSQGPIFSVDLDAHEAPERLLPLDAGAFEPLRPVAALLPGPEPALLAQARGMHHWRRTNRFCGVCGHPLTPQQGGHRLECDQGHQHFPRTDPVVIMLVRHGERALLARGVRFPAGKTVSALAGFIEPGETAEEAVAREVFEEVGVKVGAVRYLASQPWPFPGSLMLGFHADAEDTALVVDESEIVSARWVTREEVRQADPEAFTIPDRTAIARLLIDCWLEEG